MVWGSEKIRQREWRPRPLTLAPALSNDDLPDVVAQLLNVRGIGSRPELESFLNPLPHEPSLLPDMDKATQRLRTAIDAGETIGIYGDFDVDGVSGSAVVAQGLGELGAKIIPYIPHRMSEGHGLNEPAILALKEQGVSVLVTVDCGVTASREVFLAQELGMDVIITDHHLPSHTPPPATAIVNPKVAGSDYPFDGLSGGGMALKLVQGVHELVGRPWSRSLLELAALSTIADLVPLVDENRYIVSEGIKELRRTQRPGLLALYRNAGINPQSVSPVDVAFGIAPRLNAAGRLEHAAVAYQLLMTQSPAEAASLSARLERLNRERQQLTEEAWKRARETVSGWTSIPPVILVADEQLSPGIAGLVASRLVDEFNRPSIGVSIVDGVARGSARSIPGVDLVNHVLAHCSDLFTRHGGHSQAAGFELAHEKLPALQERLLHLQLDTLNDVELTPILYYDAEAPPASIPGKTFQWLKKLEPFGVDNPTPAFLSRGLQPVYVRTVGKQGQHLKLKLRQNKVTWDAMAFRMSDRWVPDTPMVDIVYTMEIDRRGSTEYLTLNVLDFRPSTS